MLNHIFILTSNVEFENKRHLSAGIDLAFVKALILLQDGIDDHVPRVWSPGWVDDAKSPVRGEHV